MRHTRKRLIKKYYTRKSKKYGGAETVFVCKNKRTTNELCIADFEEEKGFIWQDVPSDGNCFFHALELYRDFMYPYRDDNKSHKELRKIVVNFINTHFKEYEPYGITKKDIRALSKNGGWNNIAGDFVIPAAAPALNLKIKLYDLKPANKERKEKKRIILHTYPEIDSGNGIEREEVNLIRINDSHFGLLIPSTKSVSSSNETSNKNNNNNNNNTRKNSNKKLNQFEELKENLQKYRNNTSKNSGRNQFDELKTKIKEMINMYGRLDPE